MWCARNWIEARGRSILALAGNETAEHTHWRNESEEWMNALLVVNRLHLGIEPLRGERFTDVAGTYMPVSG